MFTTLSVPLPLTLSALTYATHFLPDLGSSLVDLAVFALTALALVLVLVLVLVLGHFSTETVPSLSLSPSDVFVGAPVDPPPKPRNRFVHK